MKSAVALTRDLVLVGGGHAHALVLRNFAMRPVEGLRVTLVSPASHTPYSGMLPGLVAGHYTFEETHIDLERLCGWAGVRFVCAEVTALDPGARRLTLAGRPPLDYDLLSLDIGSQPDIDSVPGARAYAVPVKPVASLWQRWRSLEAAVASGERVAVVGGGAGGVELVLAMAHRLKGRDVAFDLYCGADVILQGYNQRVRRAVERALVELDIDLHCGSRVDRVAAGSLQLANGGTATFDQLFWCTGAAAAPWLAASGLATDERGFLAVRDTLQSLDNDRVFAAGDCATQVNHPRPKAGVFAVRQGPVLADNLRACLQGKTPRDYRPQRRFLSLLSLGDKQAAADRGPFSATGNWVWRWKDRIDREFMARFSELPAMDDQARLDRLPVAGDEQPHCGGCGAKLGADGLALALTQLSDLFPQHALASEPGDDAATIKVEGGLALQSIDSLRALVADPWLMGRIAANHALSDLYACGARPLSALAMVTLPFASQELLSRDLRQVLAGALATLSEADCPLQGGHSMQGPEMQLGFAVTGTPMRDKGAMLSKRGLRVGDQLILTKALGTGVLFAAHMQQQADGRDIRSAIDMMLRSNGPAAEIAVEHGVTATTDVTGFGLLGHLLEMLSPGQGARLELHAVPLLSGAAAAAERGIRSTLYPDNYRACERYLANGVPDDPTAALLFDPQTSGGLLLGVPSAGCEAVMQSLREAGVEAAHIGEVVDGERIEFA